jgi:HD-like signal output (HDOD) protein
VRQGQCSFLEAEEEILGINHAQVGGKVAAHWNFPAEIRDAIAYHHRPDLLTSGQNKRLVRILIRSSLPDVWD